MHVWALMGAHQTALQNGYSSMEELLGPKELTKVLIMDGLIERSEEAASHHKLRRRGMSPYKTQKDNNHNQ